MSKQSSLRPEILDFARQGEDKEVSPPIDLGGAVVVEVLLDRSREEIPPFEDCQDELIREIYNRRYRQVHHLILLDLIQRSNFGPPDLFGMPGSPQSSRQGEEQVQEGDRK
jgi:hypothetical protein